ncbi:hypothetical protein [Thermococcus sibiricus]|uniref:Uncharacterized protein n=1 Tax=Thermococcus sibiricus TaxID=172049 RepID=A0A101EKL9_9EURY|nr:hypothetical protein [Thermococcus sibiricus]KUK16879.1 MAG: Uncharacterized protein XD54_1829 [Thermococcus sibiricus]
MDENKILLHYYLFTIPQITVFAGAILGILLILHVDVRKALGIFATFYGVLLIIIAALVRNQFSKLPLYRITLLFFTIFALLGILLLIM